jgi:hypothetical protein
MLPSIFKYVQGSLQVGKSWIYRLLRAIGHGARHSASWQVRHLASIVVADNLVISFGSIHWLPFGQVNTFDFGLGSTAKA